MSRRKKNVLISDGTQIEYIILKHCFLCNFGYKVGDKLTYEQTLSCLMNDGMIENFINSKDIALCQQ